MSTVIHIENVSKLYRLGEIGTGSLAHDVNRWWHKIRGREDPYLKIGQSNDRTTKGDSDYVYALRDISFDVRQGEVLGIIGRNGAGKSTLLKILSRVTTPTTGSIKMKGRIASLLEVGTGFHPELSGRDNIYLNGAILGMRKHEIDRKFDEIVEFSGCDRYIDTPVKRYSSGMYVRLAFAVAAHLEPEILVVDEVLAVGDAEFQKKCLGKMKDVAGEGRTVLFVSHNMPAVRSLCSRALFLANGKTVASGETNALVDQYLKGDSEVAREIEWNDPESAPQDELFRLNRIRVASAEGDPEIIFIQQPTHVDIEYDLLQDHSNISISIHILTQGVCAFVAGNPGVAQKAGRYRARFLIPPDLLNANPYSLTIFLIANATQFRVVLHEILNFTAMELARDVDYQGGIIGTVRPTIPWEIEMIAK